MMGPVDASSSHQRWSTAGEGEAAVGRSARPGRRPAASPGSGTRWTASSQAASSAAAGTGSCAARRTSSSRPRTCRSVPANFCTRRGGPSCGGRAGQPPGAAVAHRARPAARRAGDADQRAELHRRHREPGRAAPARPASAPAMSARSAARALPASARPCTSRATHPPHVGVDDRLRLPVAEAGHRRGRCRCRRPGSASQRGDVVGHHAAVPLDDRDARPRAAAAPGAGSRACPRRG